MRLEYMSSVARLARSMVWIRMRIQCILVVFTPFQQVVTALSLPWQCLRLINFNINFNVIFFQCDHT